MNKFKEGDRVRIKGGILTGEEYIVEYKSQEPFNCDEDQYHIKNDQKPFGFNMREGNLELIEVSESEKSQNLFKEVMDGSYYDNHSGNFGQWSGFIPDGINPNDFFKEMAEIYPGYNQDHNIKKGAFRVCVFEGNEGPVPHVHVFYGQKGSKVNVAYVCLGKADYAPQHIKETKILNTHERKALAEYFNTKIPNSYGKKRNGDFYQKTCWQSCVEHWIAENPGSEKYFKLGKDNELFEMPDYLKLGLNK